MNEIFNSKKMRLFEKEQFSKKNSFFFMQKAGNCVFEFINNNFKSKKPIIVLCGPGNNGGDGFVVAKRLMEGGYQVKVYIFTSRKNYKGDALKALEEFKGSLKKINLFKLNKKALIVDALFGIGLKRNIKGILTKVFKRIDKSKNKVVSVDIPSGVCSNTGNILGTAIKADFTITFHRKKIGHILSYGKKLSGNIKVMDIGFSQKKMKTRYYEKQTRSLVKTFPLEKTIWSQI